MESDSDIEVEMERDRDAFRFFAQELRRHIRQHDSDEEGSESSEEDNEDETLNDLLQRIKVNDPFTTEFNLEGGEEEIEEMSEEEWEELGIDISNNSYLGALRFTHGAVDNDRMSFLFRGLTRSNTIIVMELFRNGFSVEGIRSMVPFLQNSNNLRILCLNGNNIQSEGFNLLFRTLSDSPIESLHCVNCDIESIEIDGNEIPKHLKAIILDDNNINADGCRGLAKLLQGGDSTLTTLCLGNNTIDDEGVTILVDALQNNTSLTDINLNANDGISNQGKIMLLKLLNDISSIRATLQSNHTLMYVKVNGLGDEFQINIDTAARINTRCRNWYSEAAGREKVIKSQLHSDTREMLADLLGIEHSVYSEIDPLHLPEVLSLIGGRHGQGELHVALSTSIMTLFSTMNRKKCIQQEKAHHAAKIAEHRARLEELDAELGVIEAGAGNEDGEEIEHRSNKRRRKWWWGIWGV